jgi:peptide/nickel transport system substrate-binding protein
LKALFSRSGITKIQAAIIAVIIIVAAIAGAVYYITLPAPTTFRVATVGFAWPNHIDPAVGNDECSTTSLCNLYDPLVYPKAGGGVDPWVAQTWVISTDGLVYTFTIRSGIKFHSGNELKADDVAFSMNRTLAIGQGFAYLFSPYINKTEVVEGNKVRFTLGKTFGPFLATLTRLYIIEKAQVMAHLKTPGTYGDFGDFAMDWLNTHDAGSGAYTVTDSKLEEWFKYTLVTNYWGYVDPLAPTNVTQLWTTGSTTTERAMMLNKEMEVTDAWLPAEILDELGATTNISKASWPEASEYYFMLNTKKPPLDDVHVRRALAYACNYSEMMTEIYSRYTLASSCVPKGVGGYVNTQVYNTNLTKASEELSQSKYYPDIINHPENYVIEFHWIADVPERETDALLLATSAQKIGLNVQLVKTFWTKVVQEMTNLNTTGHIYNILVASSYPEAGSLIESRYHSRSAGTWEQGEWLQNSTIDGMIEDALSTINETQRFIEYQALQRLIMDLCPSLFIFDSKTTVAIQSYVKIPAVVDPSKAIVAMGYDRTYRLWQIQPH